MDQIRGYQVDVNIQQGSNFQLLPPDPRRRVIVILATNDPSWLSFDRAAAVGVGLPLHTQSSPVILRYEDVGEVLHKAVNIFISGASSTAWSFLVSRY